MHFNDFHRRLQRWYDAKGRRNLPWRNTNDAYAIYISEIMLQQTQVKTVLERFYFPFMERFPTLASLAKAKPEDVLKMWQGLGYYSRAVNLHKAAMACRDELPDSVEALVALPGIGRNTAHAVAAFAYRQPVAVMEANVKRVVSRIFAIKTPTEAELWEKAEALLNREAPFDYNQAMMDIGAMVCKKTAPLCGQCPANAICRGKASPQSYPSAKLKKKVPVRRRQIVAFRNAKGEYYASPRTTRLLGGLYQFVETEEDATHVKLGRKRFVLRQAKTLGDIRQQYSHFTLEATVSVMQAGSARGKYWHKPEALARLPFSMAEQKILALLALPKNGSR